MNSLDNISVAILGSSLEDARSIGICLREFDIYPKVFLNLDQFILGYQKDSYDLCIVDLEKTIQGKLSLEKLKAFQNNQMSCLFVYDAQSKSRIARLSEYPNFGFIKKNDEFYYKAKSSIKAFINYKNNVSRNENLRSELKVLQQKALGLEKESIQSFQQLNVLKAMGDFLSSVEELDGDYLHNLYKSLEGWSLCEEFSLLSYDNCRDDYHCLAFSSKKYKSLPSVRKGKFSFEYEQMLVDMYKPFFTSSPRVIKLKTDSNLLLVGSFNSLLKGKEAWAYLSRSLCHRSDQQVLTKSNDQKKDFVSFLDDLDKNYFEKTSTEQSCLTINFLDFCSFVSELNSSRFFWKKFTQDFSKQLQLILGQDVELVYEGVSRLYVKFDASAKKNYDLVKEYIKEFDYWSYFADKNILINQASYPHVSLTPSSSASLLRNSKHSQLSKTSASFLDL